MLTEAAKVACECKRGFSPRMKRVESRDASAIANDFASGCI